MKISISKQDKKNIIKRNLLLSLAICILPIALCVYLINVRTDPKDFEIFNIFMAVDDVNQSALYNVFKDKLVGIKKYNCYVYSPDDGFFTTYYSTIGEMDSDLIMLPFSIINEEGVSATMTEIDYRYSDNYKINEKSYGIKMNDKNGKFSVLKDIISYQNDDYYLFINKNSTHFNGHDRIGFDILETLIYEKK